VLHHILLCTSDDAVIFGIFDELCDRFILNKPDFSWMRFGIHIKIKLKLLSKLDNRRPSIIEPVPSATILRIHLPFHSDDMNKVK
jgi:hypothetical protein